MSPAKDFTGICPTASEFMVEKIEIVNTLGGPVCRHPLGTRVGISGIALTWVHSVSGSFTLLTVQLSVPLPLGGGRVTAWNYCHARSSLLTCHRTMSVVVSADNQRCQRTLLCPFRELGWRGRTRTCITSDASKTESNRVPYALTRPCEGKDAPLNENLCTTCY